ARDGGGLSPAAPRPADRPAVPVGGVAGVLRPASGTVVLHHRAARRSELLRSPRRTHGPAGRGAGRAGGRRTGPVGSQEPALGPQRAARARALLRRVAARRRPLPGAGPETDRGAERAGEGDAAARLPYHGDATGLGAGQRRDARSHGRGPAHRAGHPGQPADHRQRPAVGPRPAAPDVRAAAGDPYLLRLRLGGRRPLLDRPAVPPGAPLAPRAELGLAPPPTGARDLLPLFEGAALERHHER